MTKIHQFLNKFIQNSSPFSHNFDPLGVILSKMIQETAENRQILKYGIMHIVQFGANLKIFNLRILNLSKVLFIRKILS